MSERKAALVFGGSRGLGAAAVLRLAAEGYSVAFTYVSRKGAADSLVEDVVARGGSAVAIRADSADEEQIRSAVAEAVDLHGSLSTVVVNAGLMRVGSVDEVSVEDLDLMLSVNVRGVYLAIQAVVPHLGQGGSIITIGSNVAVSPSAGLSVYQLTKAAVAGMVESIALDLAPRGITVNNIQPGPFDTDMNAGALDSLSERNPMKRVGKTSELGGLIAYLAGPESRYVTGADFTIDGGFSL
ncbi:oxidoreductase [Rhodococcus sp. 06-156-3C]|uniref:SDR family NAD(P)-dependent oxidoreductase n=1 Tax=Nocardiaceae TaxID=85025 RepID=UPI0005230AD2|nr:MULTISPECIES: SDR family oxidoreductase [Rhodococcus]OZD12566.1 oxidoreductase [Rhodococcus sp. 06-156-4a]OZD18025.1 oxidoreductase [Rhodococcus sp. 06-156-3C]OZD20415.1 oxidoreductase [Rhodococcus sp. 06-156-4C]OZD29259.1 oxidoreductase [Rhodococcus sp. 06-156-3]OZD30531.1 oxidoreductase [Rhodococcus sp. 06-156-3b]